MLLVKTSRERVAAFLLEMAERLADDSIELPMSRADIADYLGLTIETVSRTLTELKKKAAIELPSSRRILLRNRNSLSRLNGGNSATETVYKRREQCGPRKLPAF
jgi:CRP/FNR family transcriptional regulator, nitrogen fixation regulation protein